MSRITFTRPDGTVVAVGDEATFLEALDTKFAEWKRQINMKYFSPIDGWSDDAVMLLHRSIATLNSDIEEFGEYQFFKHLSLTSVYLPKIITVTRSMFEGCSALATVQIQQATTMDINAFKGCSALMDIYAPNMTLLKEAALAGCISLRRVYFPSVTEFGGMNVVGFAAAEKCILLFPKMKKLSNYFGQGSSKNVYLVFPEKSLVTLPTTNIYGECSVYVPADMVDTYKSATNWSANASRIKAIEDDPDILAYMAEVGYDYTPTTAEVSE